MTTEFRFVPVEIRESATGPGRVEGIAVRYGDEATLPGFRERFQAGAFGDVAALDLPATLARGAAGRRPPVDLTFTDEATALRAALDLPATRDGADAAALLRRGVLRGFSLEFRVDAERFEGGVRIVERASLRGLAVVDRPAYGDSLAAIAERAAAARQVMTRNHLQRRRVWL